MPLNKLAEFGIDELLSVTLGHVFFFKKLSLKLPENLVSQIVTWKGRLFLGWVFRLVL